MRLRVAVTREDIEQGKPGDNYECPIALALQRADPSHRRWMVWCTSGDDCYTLNMLPNRVTDFIVKYDKGHKVFPFEFDVDIPDVPLSSGRRVSS